VSNNGQTPAGFSYLFGDATGEEFKHSEKGMRERRLGVAADFYNMCINASVKRAPHLVADGRVDALSREVKMELLFVSIMIRKSMSDQMLDVSPELRSIDQNITMRSTAAPTYLRFCNYTNTF
jgi:hypothetical protein